ncbi:MBL fold metallo-hydrolase [Halomarina pelagica]|uniref:MBL fold metallo-hydrolase n=1 Tax=Halomarina pelagica TaxID=2961599 RepID=UPI0020C4CF41|nr:MBL fold metallo-hydrolase [Halomarina sp. BND7]
MEPTPVPGDESVHTVDAMVLGIPGGTSLYVVDAEPPAVIDTGSAESPPRVLSALDALGVDPADVAHVVPTHVHLDHAGGAGALAEACPNATVHVHERGLPYLTDRDRLTRLCESVERAVGRPAPFGDPQLVPASRTNALSDGDRIDLGDRALDVYDAPGHAPHHVALFDPERGTLFAADAAGMCLWGSLLPTTPPPNFDLDANLDTVERLAALGPERILYGHFGPGEDAAAELAAYADLLPEWVETVEALAREREGVDEIVSALDRRWMSPTVERDVAGVLATR